MVTWVFMRGIRDEVNLPDYSFFQRLTAPAIQSIPNNPLLEEEGDRRGKKIAADVFIRVSLNV